MGYLSTRQPLLWPPRTAAVHLVVNRKRSVGDCEHNYSSFASLGVRRRDPAQRSNSWSARMVALRDVLGSQEATRAKWVLHPLICGISAAVEQSPLLLQAVHSLCEYRRTNSLKYKQLKYSFELCNAFMSHNGNINPRVHHKHILLLCSSTTSVSNNL